MFISPFTPLFFIDRKTDGIESEYIQTFAPTDKIFIQLICSPMEEPGDWVLYSEPDHEPIFVFDGAEWDINEDIGIRHATLSPSPGYYSFEVMGKKSQIFRVTDDPQILKNTTLVQYSMKDNRQRTDAAFIIDGMQRFFEIRLPGGFKDNNWTFGVESEQFSTDRADIVQLYGLESTQKKFTLGNSYGCPVWFAEMLNRILCCDYVYFDGERYARKDASVPEITTLIDGLNSFVFNQNLQKVVNIDPELTLQHQAILRRYNKDDYRIFKNTGNTATYNRLIE